MSSDNIYAEVKPPENKVDLSTKDNSNSSSTHIKSFMFRISTVSGEGVTLDYSHLRCMTHSKDYLLTLFAADIVVMIEGKGLDILDFQLARRAINQITEGTTTPEGVTIKKITINLPNLER